MSIKVITAPESSKVNPSVQHQLLSLLCRACYIEQDLSGLQDAASLGVGVGGPCTIHLVVGQEQLHDHPEHGDALCAGVSKRDDLRI